MTDDKTVYLRPPLNGIGIGDYTLRDFAATSHSSMGLDY